VAVLLVGLLPLRTNSASPRCVRCLDRCPLVALLEDLEDLCISRRNGHVSFVDWHVVVVLYPDRERCCSLWTAALARHEPRRRRFERRSDSGSLRRSSPELLCFGSISCLRHGHVYTPNTVDLTVKVLARNPPARVAALLGLAEKRVFS
jgi:hypothetical protein